MAKRTLEERQFAVQKKQLEHQRRLDYMDRAMTAVLPIVTSPVVLWLGAHWYIEYVTAKANEDTGFWGDLAHDFTGGVNLAVLDTAFIGNAFGGGAGIAQIIESVRR